MGREGGGGGWDLKGGLKTCFDYRTISVWDLGFQCPYLEGTENMYIYSMNIMAEFVERGD